MKQLYQNVTEKHSCRIFHYLHQSVLHNLSDFNLQNYTLYIDSIKTRETIDKKYSLKF